MSTAAFVSVVIAVVAGNVAMMGLVVKVIGDRIGDVVGRLDRFESRTDARFSTVDAKLDGIGSTLVDFDKRLGRLEKH